MKIVTEIILKFILDQTHEKKSILSSIHVMFWISEIKTEEMRILISFLLNSHMYVFPSLLYLS